MENMKKTFRIESDNHDRKFADDMKTNTIFLCDLIEEMVQKQPAMLLSPVCRKLLLDKTREVKHNVEKPVSWFVDNPTPGSLIYES